MTLDSRVQFPWGGARGQNLEHLENVVEFLPLVPSPGMDPGVCCHVMKANPSGYPWSKYECFYINDCQDILTSRKLTKNAIF